MMNISVTARHMKQCYRWLLQVSILIAALAAILQLHLSNRLAITANTIALVSELESKDFETAYHNTMEWMATGPGLPTNAVDADIRRDLNHILNRYATVATYVERGGIVDRTVFDATVGARLPSFWRAVGPRLTEHTEYEIIGVYAKHHNSQKVAK